MNAIVTSAAILMATITATADQSGPVFEVVSIKPRISAGRPEPMKVTPGRMDYPNATLKVLIMRAYQTTNYKMHGPAWLDEYHPYDLTAKLP